MKLKSRTPPRPRPRLFAFAVELLAISLLIAASLNLACASSLTLEAESGAAGSGFTNGTSGAVTFISVISTFATNNPGSAAKVVSFNVTFPAAGSYQLYARVRVGSGTFNDDSLLYANGFGPKNPVLNSDWVLVNGLANVGFTASTDTVTGGGSAGSGVFKWINLSSFAPGPSFSVTAGNLNQTFQIGGREDGLDMDKFVFGTAGYTFTVAELDAGGPGTAPVTRVLELPPDLVNGNLLQFNDNGAWSWYMDERAAIDKLGGKLVVGCDVSGAGVGGAPRDGEIDASIFDLATRTSQRFVLKPSGLHFGTDDHNAPALLVRPDGKYLAQYAGHNADFFSYFRVFDGTSWGAETGFDWTTVGAVNGEQTSYSNPHYLSAENRVYTFVRCIENRSPHILVSTNYGDSWFYGGQLVEPDGVVGYNSGYFRYSDNGVDRIDFICTEAHPRDIQTSIYHGYISNGMSFQSDGTVVDTNILDQLCPVSRNFTLVFSNGTIIPPGQTNYRCWNSDVQRYADGSVQCIIHARINQVASGGYPDTVNPNHAFFFCRYDGTNWATTYLCQAGYKMYSDEADYVGLGALNPADPNTIYISTAFDPRAVQPGVFDTNLPASAVHEIWKGITTNHGATFTWTPITQHSVRDNYRPLVPAWDQNNTALLWFRGNHFTAQSYDAAVVGILDRRSETPAQMTFVDATTNNTALANGAPLVPGAGAGQWHLRATGANGGSVLASADIVGEDAPTLLTTVTVPTSGTYDLWVNFWGAAATNADWRITAGLATNQMQILRQSASRTVQPGDHISPIILTNSGTNFLYQAYVGQAVASSTNTLSVFVDDNAIKAGTTSPLIGDIARTWYDGISFAKLAPLQITAITSDPLTHAISLTWSSTPVSVSLTTPTYTVQKKNALTDPSWSPLATSLPSAGSTTSFIDSSSSATAYYRISSP